MLLGKFSLGGVTYGICFRCSRVGAWAVAERSEGDDAPVMIKMLFAKAKSHVTYSFFTFTYYVPCEKGIPKDKPWGLCW